MLDKIFNFQALKHSYSPMIPTFNAVSFTLSFIVTWNPAWLTNCSFFLPVFGPILEDFWISVAVIAAVLLNFVLAPLAAFRFPECLLRQIGGSECDMNDSGDSRQKWRKKPNKLLTFHCAPFWKLFKDVTQCRFFNFVSFVVNFGEKVLIKISMMEVWPSKIVYKQNDHQI